MMRALSGAALLCLATPLVAQTPSATPWDSIARILLAPATATGGGVMRYGFPRTDLTVRIGHVTVHPAVALSSWAAFGSLGPDTVVMGDLVVTGAELGPVLTQLASDGIAVTAIHNHLASEEPGVRYVHFMGRGSPLPLAAKVGRALRHTATPLPVRPAAPAPVAIDTALLFRTIGTSGRAVGSVAQLSVNLVPEPVRLDGQPLPPALGLGSPINFQAVTASRAVATGDFTVLGPKVGPILAALARHGITATAVHNHLIGESPTLYYIHFWADGPLAEIAQGLRAALDAAR